MRVYDTRSRELREFKPLKGNRVTMFVCGPTVYDLSHIGHARTYVAYDIIAKFLRYRGYSLFYLMNITDIDDKIISRASELGVSPFELSKKMTEEFFADLQSLRIDSINLFAKASEHIPEIISQIRTLLEKGYAYTVNGDVYYDITKFPEYGKLSRQKPEELVKHRIDPNPNKVNMGDFALWKKNKPGEPAWESPWGLGRPGWHIEDTAITVNYLGCSYDIHGGAIELIFPHHEAEIAQAEAATGVKPLVNFWVHTGVLTIKGQKMSKSLKNFITIKDALKKYSAEVLRYFFASSHYRSPLDYDEEKMRQAYENVQSLNRTYREMCERVKNLEDSSSSDEKFLQQVEEIMAGLNSVMEDDFNTPQALSYLMRLSKQANIYLSQTPSKKGLKQAIQAFETFDSIFGFIQPSREGGEIIGKVIEILLDVREELRSRRMYDLSDMIRKRLLEAGVIVEDSPPKAKWRLA
ncbi:MAG: cysteine--tRNA ligase [Candidatus Bathyarchaeia archaeon]